MGTVEAASVQPGTIAWTPKGRRIEVEGPAARAGWVKIRYYHDEIGAWACADVPGVYQLSLRDPSSTAAIDAEILVTRTALLRVMVAVESGHDRCPFCSADFGGGLIDSLTARVRRLETEKGA